MNHAKKLISGLLSVVMLLVMATTAFAQEATSTTETGSASITISNASKGETYNVYKLFDATVTGKENGSIAYTGTVPDSLTNYFERDTNGYISVKDAAYTDSTKKEMSDGLRTALKAWAGNATSLAEETSDGSALTFKNLPYGYYVVTTTQGANAITVTSTNPTAKIADKNSSTPSDLRKTADSESVNIGDTVTYTVSFKTSNYDGAGSDAKKILSYTIADTLPDFLSNVNVTSIVINEGQDKDGKDITHDVTAQFTDKKITLDWYDKENNQHRYKNGSTVTITYTATVTDKAVIDDGGNTNSVTLTWTKDNGNGDGGTTPGGGGSEFTTKDTIYTYAIALQKVNEKGEKLSGATFELPFYVKKTTQDNNTEYTYAGTSAGEGLTNQVTTPDGGLIVIKGVKAGPHSIKEIEAPDGYNLLSDPFTVDAVNTGKKTTSITKYVDAQGNVTDSKTSETSFEVDVNYGISTNVKVVVNKAGTELPSTGGMGTTLFYALGGALVTGAAILLVVKKRMNRSSQ